MCRQRFVISAAMSCLSRKPYAISKNCCECLKNQRARFRCLSTREVRQNIDTGKNGKGDTELQTNIAGWCFGAITAYTSVEGCEYGDGFVVAPDGSRAGLVWAIGGRELEVVLPPDDLRWGVYAV